MGKEEKVKRVEIHHYYRLEASPEVLDFLKDTTEHLLALAERSAERRPTKVEEIAARLPRFMGKKEGEWVAISPLIRKELKELGWRLDPSEAYDIEMGEDALVVRRRQKKHPLAV